MQVVGLRAGQLLRAVRAQVVGLQDSYHGDTLGAMDLGAPSAFNGPRQTPWRAPARAPGFILPLPTLHGLLQPPAFVRAVFLDAAGMHARIAGAVCCITLTSLGNVRVQASPCERAGTAGGACSWRRPRRPWCAGAGASCRPAAQSLWPTALAVAAEPAATAE